MVIQKLQEKLYILKGRTIGLLGLAFKPDTDDLRDAPALHIAERLMQMGARVKAYDPDRECTPAASSVPTSRCATATPPRNWPAMPTPWCWSPNGASFTISTWPNSRASWPTRSWSTAATSSCPRRPIAAGFDYSGIGRCTRARAEPARGQPRSLDRHLLHFVALLPDRHADRGTQHFGARQPRAPSPYTCEPREGTPFPEIT